MQLNGLVKKRGSGDEEQRKAEGEEIDRKEDTTVNLFHQTWVHPAGMLEASAAFRQGNGTLFERSVSRGNALLFPPLPHHLNTHADSYLPRPSYT